MTARPQAQTYLYVGCYTKHSTQAIRVLAACDDGTFEQTSAVEVVEHASFLAANPNGRVLYSVSETDSFDGASSGTVNAFSVDPRDGSLELLSRVTSSGGAPCHLSVDAAGEHLFVANYASGSFAAYALDAEGDFGALIGTHTNHGSGPSPRQEGPHAHCIMPRALEPGGTSHTYGVDLGTDTVTSFAPLHAGASALAVADVLALPAGSGPRHITFLEERSLALIACELSSRLVVAEVDAISSELRILDSYSTLPSDFVGESTVAEVRVHPNGRLVYVSNRGHDSITTFQLDPQTPTFERRGWVDCGGKGPRHFVIDPTGRSLLVANEHSDDVVAFDIDTESGLLRPRGPIASAGSPVCLMFLEAG